MKRTLLLLVGMTVLSTVCLSQIKIGVKGGLNVSTYFFDPEPDEDIKPLASFNLGAFLTYSFTDNIGLHTELLYSGEGGRLVTETTGDLGLGDGFEDLDFEIRDRINWLSLPVLVKYHSEMGITAEAGLIFNFLLKAKTTISLSNDDASTSISQKINDNLSGVDTRLGFGLGYELPSGLSFNGRLAVSLGNIYTQEFTDDNAGLEGGLTVFQLSAGFPIFAK